MSGVRAHDRGSVRRQTTQAAWTGCIASSRSSNRGPATHSGGSSEESDVPTFVIPLYRYQENQFSTNSRNSLHCQTARASWLRAPHAPLEFFNEILHDDDARG